MLNSCIKAKPKVMVLTLYCGEPQYQRCIESVNSQIDVDYRHVVIENKPNVEAHRELYELINKSVKNYDYFLKLDADMEFSSPDAISRIVNFFDKDVDHLQIPVFDFLTNSDIRALNVFSCRVKIDTSKMDHLYVDNVNIVYPGSRRSEKESFGIVYHCYNPSQSQCFTFGVHRALKVSQSDRFVPSLSNSKSQYRILRKIYNELKPHCEKDVRHVALTSAIMVFNGEIYGTMDEKKKFLSADVFFDWDEASADKWFGGNEILSIIKVLGLTRFVLGCTRSILLNATKLAR
jgi:hypothetical protein